MSQGSNKPSSGSNNNNNNGAAFRFSNLGGEPGGELGSVGSGRDASRLATATPTTSASQSSASAARSQASTAPQHQSSAGVSGGTGAGAGAGAGAVTKTTKQQAEQQAGSRTTSSSHRLSSIDILNENRQRQLKLKEQESFKVHLEQRQKIIKQQQQASSIKQQSEDNNASDQLDDSADNLDVTYQVNTSAPDYMAKAVQAAAADGRTRSGKGYIAVNPFDEEAAKMIKRPNSAAAEPSPAAVVSPPGEKSATVSGFLSSLGGDAAEGPSKGASEDELMQNSKRLLEDARRQQQQMQQQGTATRYAKVLEEGKTSYNYDDDPSKTPFYKKDFATLLQESRGSPNLVILIVAIALLLDNMLLTSVVPIIPAYLYKLRIERQHRDLLEREPPPMNNKSTSGGWRDSTLGDDSQSFDREEELARRINQSLAAAKDRFSGSVFHPRVKTKLMKAAKDDDDEDDDGSNDEVDDKDSGDDRRRASDDDHDDVPAMRQRGQRRKIQRPQKQNSQQGRPGRKKQENDAMGDDDNEDDDADADSDDDEGDDDEKPQRASARKRPERLMREISSPSERLEDDDEDRDDSAKWTKLRDSLVAMARRGRNDTDQLGGMCLSMVLNPEAMESGLDGESGRTTERLDESPPRKQKNQNQKNRQEKQDSPQNNKEKIKTGPLKKVIKPKGKPPKAKDREEQVSTPSPPSPKDDEELVISHQDIVDESFEVGVMFASKPIVQAFANPFIGTLTNRVGFTIPMFTGFVIMFLSTLVFAFGSTYSTLFIARAIQGVGSACTSVAGMSMLADRFPDDAERGQAMSIALGGLALGVVIGPPFGGFMYEFVGKASPFIVLSILALLDGLLQLLVLQPRVTENQEEGASLLTLIKDPYILVAAGAITFANTGIAILEPALPLWMMDTMQATNWEQGVAFLPAALSYMFGTNFSGNLGLKIGRWRATLIGLVVIGCSLLLIPFATRVDHLIIPNGAIGFAMGMVDSSMMPMLGYLVDIRHTSVYGSVYAIGDVAFCASFAFGPALSGTLVELIGFEGLIITTALICFAFAPLLLLLRNPPARQVNEAQLQEQSLRYVNYNQLDSPDEEAQLTGGDYKSTASKAYVR